MALYPILASRNDLLEILEGRPKTFDGNGPTNAKIWHGIATTDSNGDWTINLSAAGFSSPPVITTSAELSTATVTDQVWSTIRTKSATSAAGTCLRGATLLGLGLATVRRAPAGVVVHVQAVGV